MLCNNLDEVRTNIDRIDNEIIKLIAERGTYVAQAAAFKKDENGVKDTNRVEKVITKVRLKAEQYGANPDMVEKLYLKDSKNTPTSLGGGWIAFLKLH